MSLRRAKAGSRRMAGRSRGSDRRSGARRSSIRAAQTEQPPVEILASQMALASFARVSGDWQAFERARDTAVRLALRQRIDDEVRRFRQVMAACTRLAGVRGEDARELILRRLSDAFTEGVARGETVTDVFVRGLRRRSSRRSRGRAGLEPGRRRRRALCRGPAVRERPTGRRRRRGVRRGARPDRRDVDEARLGQFRDAAAEDPPGRAAP